ncbi:MAG: hypothetical protein Q4C17_04710 [Bacillota bacterium]|nr:hypothetical protein [Bacillota bacterium]MDO4472444.1 hypothetical protein [Bacillota bacterium]
MEKAKGFWSAGRLVVGIILFVMSMFILFQSCAAGLVNAWEESSDMGGTAGILVVILMISTGVIAICTRNSASKGGPGTCAGLLFLAAVIGFCNAGVFSDLAVWSVVNIAFGIIFLICTIKTKRRIDL